METERNILTDEKWNAIIHNDVSYDGVFYYAVKTTGIFCRPSYKSRVPNIRKTYWCLLRLKQR